MVRRRHEKTALTSSTNKDRSDSHAAPAGDVNSSGLDKGDVPVTPGPAGGRMLTDLRMQRGFVSPGPVDGGVKLTLKLKGLQTPKKRGISSGESHEEGGPPEKRRRRRKNKAKPTAASGNRKPPQQRKPSKRPQWEEDVDSAYDSEGDITGAGGAATNTQPAAKPKSAADAVLGDWHESDDWEEPWQDPEPAEVLWTDFRVNRPTQTMLIYCRPSDGRVMDARVRQPNGKDLMFRWHGARGQRRFEDWAGFWEARRRRRTL